MELELLVGPFWSGQGKNRSKVDFLTFFRFLKIGVEKLGLFQDFSWKYFDLFCSGPRLKLALKGQFLGRLGPPRAGLGQNGPLRHGVRAPGRPKLVGGWFRVSLRLVQKNGPDPWKFFENFSKMEILKLGKWAKFSKRSNFGNLPKFG